MDGQKNTGGTKVQTERKIYRYGWMNNRDTNNNKDYTQTGRQTDRQTDVRSI